jgi:hypothetical protein
MYLNVIVEETEVIDCLRKLGIPEGSLNAGIGQHKYCFPNERQKSGHQKRQAFQFDLHTL